MQLENSILVSLDYKILEHTLYDWVSSYLEIAKTKIQNRFRSEIRKVACLFIDFVYEEKKIVSNEPIGVVAIAIIQCALVVLTKFTGVFDFVNLLALAIHQDVQIILNLSQVILKYSLGEEFYYSFNFC